MEVKLELYNKSTNGYEALDWLTQNGKTKFSWESEERLTEDGGLYMETVLKSYAANSNFKKNNFKFFDYNEGIFSYSSPLFFEEGLFSISDKLLAFQRLGYEINRAEVRVLSMFQITDKKLVSFRNPVFDIYYKSKDPPMSGKMSLGTGSRSYLFAFRSFGSFRKCLLRSHSSIK